MSKLLITVAAASIAFGSQRSKAGIFAAKVILGFSSLACFVAGYMVWAFYPST